MLKLFKYLKPYKYTIYVIIILTFTQTITQLFLPTLMSDIVDIGIENKDFSYIFKIGLIMLIVALLGAICVVYANYLSAKTAVGFGRDLRSKLFSHVQSFSLHEFDQIGTASLITRTTNDITQVQNVIIVILRMMLTAPVMCIGGIIMAVKKDSKLSLIILIILPLLVGIISIVAVKGIPLFKKMQEKLDRLNLVMRENLNGIRVIRAFNRDEYEKEKFNVANMELTNTATRVNKIMAVVMPMMMIIFNFTTIAIIWFGGIRINNGYMQVGDLMAFIQYIMQIMFSLIMVSLMFVFIPKASVSAVRINEVLNITPEIKDIINESIEDDTEIKGYIEFQNVTFSYPGAEEPAIKDISFKAGPGEITAIIGSTGSGKSTLINLIPRFYDIDNGSILIDGKSITEMTQDTLRKKIGFVPQKAILFNGTNSDNIK